MPRTNQYANYGNLYSRYSDHSVLCHLCDVSMKLNVYQQHMKKHDINPKTQCVFCCGNYKWQSGEKSTRAHVALHLLKCLKKFLKLQNEPMHDMPPKPKPLMDDTCSVALQHGFVRRMDGRERHPEWLDFYDDVGREPDFLTTLNVPHHVRFTRESGLGHEIHAIFHAYRTGRFYWYHAMVKAEAWSDFKRDIAPHVFFLPYWTLCDGRKKNDVEVPEAQRHHRHMILLVQETQKSYFQHLWRTCVKLTDVDAKWHGEIKCLLHLMNTVYYVSNPHAICDGVQYDISAHAPSHYWIGREMYRHAKFAIAGLFRDGYKEWVRLRVQNRNATWFEEVQGKRRKLLRIEHFHLQPHGCVVPFEKDIRPSHIVTLADNQLPDALFLYHYEPNTYWVLEENVKELEQLPYEAWCEHQRARNNCFVDTLEAFDYELGNRQSNMVNQLRKVVKEKESLHREECQSKDKLVKDMQMERDNVYRRMDEKDLKHEEEHVAMKLKHAELEREQEEIVAEMKRKHEQERAERKREQAELEREQEEMKRKHEQERAERKREQEKIVQVVESIQQHVMDIEYQPPQTEKVLIVIAGLTNVKQQLQEE